jgi:hypothetical protein
LCCAFLSIFKLKVIHEHLEGCTCSRSQLQVAVGQVVNVKGRTWPGQFQLFVVFCDVLVAQLSVCASLISDTAPLCATQESTSRAGKAG